MGRKAKEFDEKELAQFEALSAYLTLEQIADYFRVFRKPLQNMRQRNNELDTLYKKGKAKSINKVGSSLMENCLSGNVTAQIFYLKTQGGWRETDRPVDDGAQNLNISFSVREPVGDVRVTNGED